MEEIRAELRGTMGGKHHSLIDDDDEEKGDDDVYMYSADMHPDEQDEYREAVRASNADGGRKRKWWFLERESLTSL